MLSCYFAVVGRGLVAECEKGEEVRSEEEKIVERGQRRPDDVLQQGIDY